MYTPPPSPLFVVPQESRPAGAINEAQQQVAFADVVLLNKVDLVQESDLQAVESAITGINAEAEVVRCERCVVDLGRILHTGSYTGGGVEHGGEERNGKEEIKGSDVDFVRVLVWQLSTLGACLLS